MPASAHEQLDDDELANALDPNAMPCECHMDIPTASRSH
jgi:hypothetical protein